jgi:hypothetical protein
MFDKRILNILMFLIPFLLSLSAQSDILITEIMQNPAAVSDSCGEWFEIVNTGNSMINLQGWKIQDNHTELYSIPHLLFIYPDQYFVFGNQSDVGLNGGVSIDHQYSDITLDDSSDALIIVNVDGEIVDSVAWDGGVTFPDPEGASMALLDTVLDNNIGSNWVISTTTFGDGDFGTPGYPNFCGDILLSQLSVSFDTTYIGCTDTIDIKLYNLGTADVIIDTLYTYSKEFQAFFDTMVVAVSDSAIISITFQPAEYGAATEFLIIELSGNIESML